MKTKCNNYKFYIAHAGYLPAGHGHKLIFVEINVGDLYKQFSATTDNMSDFDKALDLTDRKSYYKALYDLVADQLNDEIEDWIFENI